MSMNQVDQILTQNQVEAAAAGRAILSIVTILGLIAIAAIVIKDGATGLMLLMMLITGVAACFVLKFHDDLEMARARLDA